MKVYCEVCKKAMMVDSRQANAKISCFKCAFELCAEIREKISPESEAYYKQFMK